MSDAIITGPGLYVLRNGRPQWIDRFDDEGGWWRSATENFDEWKSDGTYILRGVNRKFDIIRRATPEEAARFCGGGE
ncbi:hypothetical protein [Acidiphilium sp.]|uniref:hypothetical protein n=1 Tax=Acidiphilium sp. TaxID=527 RepID=UPI002D0DDD7F|nr:hypothetical protein [Acidiphilium sp.]HQT62798.1 hypothetical protein [Acidiphilium sp.]